MVRVQGFFALVLKRLCVCIAFVPVVIGVVPGYWKGRCVLIA